MPADLVESYFAPLETDLKINEYDHKMKDHSLLPVKVKFNRKSINKWNLIKYLYLKIINRIFMPVSQKPSDII